MSRRTTKQRRAARVRNALYRFGTYAAIDRTWSPGHYLALWGTLDLGEAIRAAYRGICVPVVITGLEESCAAP